MTGETDQMNRHQRQSHSRLDINAALFVVNVLVDSGYFRSIVYSGQRRLLAGKHKDLKTNGCRMRASCGVGTVNICTDNGNSANSDDLVVCFGFVLR